MRQGVMFSIIYIIFFSFTLSFSLPGLAATKNSSQQLLEKSWLLQDEKNTSTVFAQSSQLVVSVDSSALVRSGFFGFDVSEVPAGSGSGFIWDDKGHVVTNYHVIQSARKLYVTTKDGKKHEAIVVGKEPRKDIAVLRVKSLKGKFPGFSKTLADTNKLMVGQKVLAIGNPYGFEQSLTQGIVSALNRSMPSVLRQFTIRGMIQTDAAINPGNSGGPLLDSRGYLLGMNTSIISQTGSSAGLGFAVPTNTIKRIAGQIIKHGKITQPGLGIEVLPAYYKNAAERIMVLTSMGLSSKRQFQEAPLKRLVLKVLPQLDVGVLSWVM